MMTTLFILHLVVAMSIFPDVLPVGCEVVGSLYSFTHQLVMLLIVVAHRLGKIQQGFHDGNPAAYLDVDAAFTQQEVTLGQHMTRTMQIDGQHVGPQLAGQVESALVETLYAAILRAGPLGEYADAVATFVERAQLLHVVLYAIASKYKRKSPSSAELSENIVEHRWMNWVLVGVLACVLFLVPKAMSLFYDAIRGLDPNVQLASYFSGQLRDQIKLGDDNEAVIKVVREEAASAYDRTYQVLSQRIDKFGVAQPTIQKLSASERILVELPGVKEPERVRKLLQGTAQLEFWLTHDNTEVAKDLIAADEYLGSINKGVVADTVAAEAETEAVAEVKDSTEALLDQLTADNNNQAGVSDASREEFAKEHPLLAKLQLYVDNNCMPLQCPIVGLAAGKDRETINEMLAAAAEKKVFDTRTVKFLWSAKPDEHFGGDVYTLYAIKITTRDGSALLDGGCISDARQDFSNVGGNEISMTMNNEGAREWKRITGENVGNCIAIVLTARLPVAAPPLPATLRLKRPRTLPTS